MKNASKPTVSAILAKRGLNPPGIMNSSGRLNRSRNRVVTFSANTSSSKMSRALDENRHAVRQAGHLAEEQAALRDEEQTPLVPRDHAVSRVREIRPRRRDVALRWAEP